MRMVQETDTSRMFGENRGFNVKVNTSNHCDLAAQEIAIGRAI